MNLKEFPFTFSSNDWVASTERTLFHPGSSSLLLSDLHLGKATHFRKNYLPIPGQIETLDLHRLRALVEYYQPKRLILLGDLFHSEYNDAWKGFASLMAAYPEIQKMLVQGNHDILPQTLYSDCGLHTVAQFEMECGVMLLHDQADMVEDKPCISGHIHTAYTLQGKAKQYVKLPCFYVAEKFIWMPAWGKLTGLKSVEKLSEKDIVLAFTENKFWKI